jgi:dTMP kinase
MPSINHTGRGRLISLEGLNGVGKTYLTTRVVDAAAEHGKPPLVVEEFSRRSDSDSDLGRRLLRTLVTASHGERFLRAGFPKSETLLLLAIKMHDFETTLPALLAGRTVIEGRSIHSTAVYQSLIMNPGDDRAAALFEHLATIDPEHMRLLDRRQHSVEALVATISEWIATAPVRPLDVLAPAVARQ